MNARYVPLTSACKVGVSTPCEQSDGLVGPRGVEDSYGLVTRGDLASCRSTSRAPLWGHTIASPISAEAARPSVADSGELSTTVREGSQQLVVNRPERTVGHYEQNITGHGV